MIQTSSLNYFYQKLDQLINKHCPKNNIIKKQQKYLPRPWLTKGILKSIKEKSKTNKQFCKSTDSLKKNKLHIKFKTYRSSIIKLTRQCKKTILSPTSNIKKTQNNMERHRESHKHKR